MNKPNFKARDIITVEITGLGSSGEGVGKVDGFTVFVKGALSGETVEVILDKVKKNYATGKLLKILEVSPDRVEPRCKVYENCGGCQLQHLEYNAQLKGKDQQVKDALTRIGHLENIEYLPIIGEKDPWYYRNKMQFPVASNNGEIAIGCYAAATHQVIGVDDCLIQNEANNKIAQTVHAWMEKYEVPAYNEKTGKGIVRHVMGRVGINSGEVMAVIITSSYDLPYNKELVSMLREAMPNLKSIVQTDRKSVV